MKRNHEISLMATGSLLAVSFGVGFSWWYNQPPTPWLEFHRIQAYYDAKEPSVRVFGTYQVNDKCVAKDNKDPVIWRMEAEATDGQVPSYAPRPPKPSLDAGWHRLDTAIPLEEKIYPDGWAVRILVTCPGEKPETIASQPAVVDIGEGGGSP